MQWEYDQVILVRLLISDLVIQQVKIRRKKCVGDNMAALYRHTQIYSFYLNPEYPVLFREKEFRQGLENAKTG